MKSVGIAIYTPPASTADEAPWTTTAPRFYVSVTDAAWEKWPNGAPPPPPDLAEILWPHQADFDHPSGNWPNKIRGLGWALAPPHSDPQALHADIWGGPGKPRKNRVRFHHFLWKRQPGVNCTTEIIPGGFTDGNTQDADYRQL